jgi:hypothetical protein
MSIFDAHISTQVSDFLKNTLKNITFFETANQKIYTQRKKDLGFYPNSKSLNLRPIN